MDIKRETIKDVLLNVHNTLVVLSDIPPAVRGFIESDIEEIKMNLVLVVDVLKEESGMSEEDIFE